MPQAHSEMNRYLFLYLIVLSVLPHDARAQSLHTLDTVAQPARLVALTATDLWTLAVNNQERKVASSALVRWGSWPGVLDEQAVWLSDGSFLCGPLDISGSQVTLTNDWLDSPPLAWETIRGLVLAPPTTLANWLALQTQMEAVRGDQDMVWLSGGRKLSGILRVVPTSNSDQTSIDIDTAGQTVTMTLDEIEAIVFSPTLLGPLPTHVDATSLCLVDGSRLWVTHVTPGPSSVELTLENALSLKSFDAAPQFIPAIVSLARPQANTQFLSDLPPASYRHLPDSTLTWKLGTDLDVFNQSLHNEKGMFPRGLATHSSSQVAFRWDGTAAQFLAEARLAAPAPQADPALGSVRCQVLLARDGKLQTVREFSLERIAPSAQALADRKTCELISVDLLGAELVVLVTDKADFAQYGDQLLWLDARITRR